MTTSVDDLTLFDAAQQAFGERVHAVAPHQWRAATPAASWDVEHLVRHIVDEHRWAVPLVEGLELDAAAKVVDGARRLPIDGGVGANLVQEWDDAARASARALRAEGALERSVQLTRGPASASAYLRELVFDLTIHCWDLGTAIGYPHPLPDVLVDEMHTRLVRVGGDLSMSGLFDAPVDVPDDAPTIDKLVALTGRDPH